MSVYAIYEKEQKVREDHFVSDSHKGTTRTVVHFAGPKARTIEVQLGFGDENREKKYLTEKIIREERDVFTSEVGAGMKSGY